MGEKIPDDPDDYVKGLDCLCCFDLGKTPKYLFIRFWDITACIGNPKPPNGYTFIAVQHYAHGCAYEGELDFGGSTWRVNLNLCVWYIDKMVSTITLGIVGSEVPAYFEEHTTPCTMDFMTNSLTCPDWGGEGGHAHVEIFGPPIIILLCSGFPTIHPFLPHGFGFVTQPKRLYEMKEVGMDHTLVRIATKFDKTRIYFYIDNEDLPPHTD